MKDNKEFLDDLVADTREQSVNEAKNEKSTIAKTGEDLAKKTIEQATKKGAQKQVVTKAITSALGPLIPYISIAIVIIFILIAIIGIIGFFCTIPGLMKDKLKSFATGISDWWKGLYKTQANVSIKDEDIVELGNYIADMGYDLIGFGFITPKDEKNIITSESLEADGYTEERDESNGTVKYIKEGSYYKAAFIYKDGHSYNGNTGEMIEYVSYTDEVNNKKKEHSSDYTRFGIKYDSEGKISSFDKVDSSLLRKYAIANARNQILRNHDNNWNIVNFIHGIFYGSNDSYDSWSRGLIFLYEAKDYIANNQLGGKDGIKLFSDVELKNEGKTLRIKKAFNTAMEFNTDGWSGRYGLTQDFLISLHLATLSPDLVETIVETYDTEVQVYLDEVEKATAHVKMVDTSSTEIGIPDGKDYTDKDVGLSISDFTNGKVKDAGIKVNDKGLDIDGWWISKKEAARFYYLSDMDSPLYCTNGYDLGIADLHIVDGNSTRYFRNFISTFPLQEGHAKHIYQYYDYYNNVNHESQHSNIITPSYLRLMVNNSLKDYDKYGFSYDDFKKEVIMEATGDTAVKNLLPEKYVNEYDSSDGEWYDTRLNYGNIDGYEYMGNILGTLNLRDSDTNDFDDSAYSEILSQLKKDNPNIDFNMYEYLKYHVGSECIYDRGKPCVVTESQGAYFSQIYGGYCNCAFCSTFYNKYSALQNFVNHWLEDSVDCLDINTEEGEAIYDAILDAGEIDYYDYNDNHLYAISHLYEWEYNGEIYRISFYYDEEIDKDGTIGLVVNKGWSDDEWNDWISKSQAGCAQIVKEAGSLKKAQKVKICGNCKRYIKYIVWSLKKLNDEKFKTYVPYIARVVNSWFRDTYFIIPENDNDDFAIQKAENEFGYKENELTGKNLSVIKNDEEFLEATGELWTDYVKYYNNYATFLLNYNGEQFKNEDEVKKFLDDKGISSEERAKLDNYIQLKYNYVNIDKNINVDTFGLWTAETDRDFQTDSEKEANEILKKYNIAIDKIALSKKVGEVDSEGYTSNKIAWNAYGPDTNGSNSVKWQQIEIGDDYPWYMRKVRDSYKGSDDNGNSGELNFYVELKGVFNFIQLTDAQRGMTNSKIKYLFKNRKYYKYDGSVQRAYDIYNDWLECKKIFGDSRSNVNEVLNDYYFGKTVSTSYKFARDFNDDGIADIASPNISSKTYNDSVTGKSLNIDDDKTSRTYDPRNPSLIDNIDLTLESLSAFSILENTPSADADYAYRDLKELLVELDYFDKEDLTEPAKDVFEWLLPISDSAGWPYRTYDKTEEYGTLIHSNIMYDTLEDINSSDDTGTSISASLFEGFKKGEPIVSPATARILEIGTVTVDNENKEKVLDTYYVSDETKDPSNTNIEDSESTAKKSIVSQAQYDSISEKAQKMEADESNPFGKSYKTGYVKLEIIGEESIARFKTLQKDGYITEELYNGLKTFYEEYYNKANNKSICDSYTIYIEGIDLTGNLEEEGGSLNEDLSNTILAKLFNQNTDGANFTDSGFSTTNDYDESAINASSTTVIDELKLNYYTEKEAPIYYTQNAKRNIKLKESKKADLPSIIKLDKADSEGKNNGAIYIKAGTILGVTGDANIKIIMKNKDNAIVENIEEYIEIDDIEDEN